MYDLAHFTLRDMTECGAALRKFGSKAESMEEVANEVVRYLYDHLADKLTGEKSCALVRFYKTHSYQELDGDLRQFADMLFGDQLEPPDGRMKCLTLLATAGEKPEWNSKENSVGHKVFPLASEEVVVQMPMISQLLKQFGLEFSTMLGSVPSLLMDSEQTSFNVFYVPEAVGSPYIPAQEEFVIPFDIKSVLGFGGMLPSGDLFAIVVFSKVHVPRETVNMFKTLALNVKMALLPFERQATFA